MHMINSGAKGTTTHATHMAVAIGQQYVGGREGIFCERPYSEGLTPGRIFRTSDGREGGRREHRRAHGVHWIPQQERVQGHGRSEIAVQQLLWPIM